MAQAQVSAEFDNRQSSNGSGNHNVTTQINGRKRKLSHPVRSPATLHDGDSTEQERERRASSIRYVVTSAAQYNTLIAEVGSSLPTSTAMTKFDDLEPARKRYVVSVPTPISWSLSLEDLQRQHALRNSPDYVPADMCEITSLSTWTYNIPTVNSRAVAGKALKARAAGSAARTLGINTHGSNNYNLLDSPIATSPAFASSAAVVIPRATGARGRGGRGRGRWANHVHVHSAARRNGADSHSGMTGLAVVGAPKLKRAGSATSLNVAANDRRGLAVGMQRQISDDPMTQDLDDPISRGGSPIPPINAPGMSAFAEADDDSPDDDEYKPMRAKNRNAPRSSPPLRVPAASANRTGTSRGRGRKKTGRAAMHTAGVAAAASSHGLVSGSEYDSDGSVTSVPSAAIPKGRIRIPYAHEVDSDAADSAVAEVAETAAGTEAEDAEIDTAQPLKRMKSLPLLSTASSRRATVNNTPKLHSPLANSFTGPEGHGASSLKNQIVTASALQVDDTASS